LIVPRLLDLFANRGGPLTLILKMLGNLVPHYLAIAIPAAFFVGILYATLRLSNDSELDVMRASGLSLRRLAAPMLGVASLAFGVWYGAAAWSVFPYPF